ncbi:MAG: ATP-binding cassette domain-containing protein [Eubacteriales bacterium]
MENTILKIQNVSKTYGQVKALIDFTYDFGPGVYALLGPNGSGKSTLMNIITDNLKADSGEITYKGTEILKLGAAFREKLGFMPQYPGMYPSFTALDFLSYIAVLKGVKRKAAKKQISDLLEAVELTDVRRHKIKSFSGGMKQRLALAQAFIGDPEIIILDEPTAGLDPKQRISVRNYISENAVSKTVIIATHVVQDIEFISREIIMLKKGVILDSGSVSSLREKAFGKVWETSINEEDFGTARENYRIVNVRSEGDKIFFRVLSDTKPDENSTEAAPSLEDYYLYCFGEKAHEAI